MVGSGEEYDSAHDLTEERPTAVSSIVYGMAHLGASNKQRTYLGQLQAACLLGELL